MLPILIVAALAYGSSQAFYSQSELGYVACLLLIFIMGHFAGHVSSKHSSIIVRRLDPSEGDCPHEQEIKELKQDLFWIVEIITSPITLTTVEEVRVFNKRMAAIKQKWDI
jgi:hypothetical protein